MSLMDDDFDIDSTCSTPYVSAPSSPGRSSSGSAAAPADGGFFYSAPASPMHFILSSSALTPPPKTSPEASVSNSFEFEFSARFPSAATADELFLNGQIRPMKLSSHLQRPQILAPLIDLDESEPDLDNAAAARGRGEAKWRDRSLRRRTRSMSPLRTSATWHEIEEKQREEKEEVTAEDETPSMSASSSRSSSGNRSSKRWIFLKEFLYRSKSEGRNNSHKFWNNFSFSAVKDKKPPEAAVSASTAAASVSHSTSTPLEPKGKKKAGPTNGVGKRRVPASPHEIHYRANRAQAEEMRKKTFLPYRQGLIGCLGFSSKSYGAVNGLARALNPVSSR